MSSGGVASVFRHALVFGMAPVLQKLISALLLPYFTHYLQPAEYGLRDFLVAVTGFFPVLFALEYRIGFIRNFVATKNHAERRRLFTGSFLLMALLAALASVTFLLAWPAVAQLYPEARIGGFFRCVLAVGIFVDVVNLILLAAAQANLWSGRMVTLNLAQFSVGVVLNVFFVVFLELGPLGLFLGNASASLLALVGLLYITRSLFTRFPKFSLALRICRPGLFYSYPLWFGAITYFALRNADRFVLSGLGGLATLGLYGMAWKLSNLLVQFVLVPFQTSFDVWRFKIYEEGRPPDQVADIFRFFVLGVGAMALAMATGGVDAFTWLADPRYREVAFYLPWLNAAVLLQCGYAVTSSAFYVTGKTGVWVRLFLVAAILQIGGCYLAVSAFGPYGAPPALIITNLFLYVGSIVYGRRLWPVDYPHDIGAGVLVLVTGLSLLRRLAEPVLVLGLAADAAICGLYVLVVLQFGWISPGELEYGWKAVRKRLSRRKRNSPEE